MAAGWTVTCSWRGVRCLQSSCQDRWPKASCHHREHHVYNLDLIQRMRWPIQTWPPACWHGTLTKKFEPQLVGWKSFSQRTASVKNVQAGWPLTKRTAAQCHLTAQKKHFVRVRRGKCFGLKYLVLSTQTWTEYVPMSCQKTSSFAARTTAAKLRKNTKMFVFLQVKSGKCGLTRPILYSGNYAVMFPPLARKPTYQLMFFWVAENTLLQ